MERERGEPNRCDEKIVGGREIPHNVNSVHQALALD
jgi:hypothetical protein